MTGIELGFMVAAGIVTAVVCGFETAPFFFIDEISDRLTVILWGFAGEIMLFVFIFAHGGRDSHGLRCKPVDEKVHPGSCQGDSS
jgi:zinc transporter ZupT